VKICSAFTMIAESSGADFSVAVIPQFGHERLFKPGMKKENSRFSA
jgi:hypothetical protein